ncbi:hypothetical protein TNCT_525181 [Trichonephila clavata]|uniref:Uncharacterized protein n=1 Tax=Trichonephila clavata TaxID=2740835 RepID=A0A8X6GZW7_TRICU|nr:hypothetical protein TNCT_525181 [Trichonephila clavata]
MSILYHQGCFAMQEKPGIWFGPGMDYMVNTSKPSRSSFWTFWGFTIDLLVDATITNLPVSFDYFCGVIDNFDDRHT